MTEELEVHKDACGQEVKIGDLVAYVSPGAHALKEGNILRFTPKGMTMDLGKGDQCYRHPSQVVKLPSTLRLERMLGA